MSGFCLTVGTHCHEAWSWNALGHRLVAQIAYDNLSKEAKKQYNRYNRALNSVYRPQSLVYSAAWMDSLRYRDKLWLEKKHYIDIPFTFDGSKLIEPNQENAVSAIESAESILQRSKFNYFEKGFSLRILLHVIGDIHQPLHAANQFSQAHPNGDLGGNLFKLGRNDIASNLHAYWDKGGGALLSAARYSPTQVKSLAQSIQKKWPCRINEMELNPSIWAQESHQLAIHEAYKLTPLETPSKNYQKNVQTIALKRIALAGCRLAGVLNQLYHPS